MNAKIVVVHGESTSVFHVVDLDAPAAQQPAILASYSHRANAEQALIGAATFGPRYFAIGCPTEWTQP